MSKQYLPYASQKLKRKEEQATEEFLTENVIHVTYLTTGAWSGTDAPANCNTVEHDKI